MRIVALVVRLVSAYLVGVASGELIRADNWLLALALTSLWARDMVLQFEINAK